MIGVATATAENNEMHAGISVKAITSEHDYELIDVRTGETTLYFNQCRSHFRCKNRCTYSSNDLRFGGNLDCNAQLFFQSLSHSDIFGNSTG